MFLVILDDGTIKKTKEISKACMEEAENGNVDIIDISNPLKPLWYYQYGEWTEVETL